MSTRPADTVRDTGAARYLVHRDIYGSWVARIAPRPGYGISSRILGCYSDRAAAIAACDRDIYRGGGR